VSAVKAKFNCFLQLYLYRRVNPVEVIYSALPALLYFNSSFVHDLLLPLFEFQSSSSAPYASSDLGWYIHPKFTAPTLMVHMPSGNEYPVFSNNVNTDPKQAIERTLCANTRFISLNSSLPTTECGNMLIMAYAHATKSGDGSLINNPKYVNRPLLLLGAVP
jgi:hypothetical protein